MSVQPISNILLINKASFINLEGIRCVSPVLEVTGGAYQITVSYEKGDPVDLVLKDLPFATSVAEAIYKHWVSYTEYQKHVCYERMLKQMDIF